MIPVSLYHVYCEKYLYWIALYTTNFVLSMFSFISFIYKFSYLVKRYTNVTVNLCTLNLQKKYALVNCLWITGRNYQMWWLQQIIHGNVKYKYFCYHIYRNDIKILSEWHLNSSYFIRSNYKLDIRYCEHIYWHTSDRTKHVS